MHMVDLAAAAQALEACAYTPTSEMKPTPYITHTTTTVMRMNLQVRRALSISACSLSPLVCRDIRCIHS
jgi:CRISPR/Cas system-associated protein Cas7 (RAMP superfamily)